MIIYACFTFHSVQINMGNLQARFVRAYQEVSVHCLTLGGGEIKFKKNRKKKREDFVCMKIHHLI